MPRFFVEKGRISADTVWLEEAELRHLRVLRLRPEETFTVCDGKGRTYLCRLREDGQSAAILRTAASEGEPTVDCTIFAAFAKGEKTDWIIQKSVELGAAELVLFPSARCVARVTPETLSKKLTRWQKISEEAAKQCGRDRIPPIRAMSTFADAAEAAGGASLPLFFYEAETRTGLRQALAEEDAPRTISIFTGPEGGFTTEEATLAKHAGLRSVSLGKRILRCETAPLAALAAVMYHSGNL